MRTRALVLAAAIGGVALVVIWTSSYGNAWGHGANASIDTIPDDLIAKHLTLPVEGTKTEDLSPQFFDARGQRGHEAIDIPARRGQPVVAVEDGRIAKLFLSKPGGLTIYQFDPTSKFAYYYAHLDRYADGLAEGARVTRGQIIGYVGSTGNADPCYPHLHFGIFRLGPEAQWWKGEALDPYPALKAASE
jgi:peptidoglycan LD-endopeptidase LytH